MKKSAIILSILSVCFFSGVAFAEGQNMEDVGGKGKMGGKGGMMHEQPKIVATSDGGVIVLAGRKLLKYDGLLNLVKEVEMKGGPSPKKMAEIAKPMDDAEIAAMLNEAPTETPVAPDVPWEATAGQDQTAG